MSDLSPTPDGDPGERHTLGQGAFEALAAFRLELRRYLSFAEAVAAAHGLTMPQHQAMLAIRASADGGLTVGGLAETLLVRHHSTVEMIQRLNAAGLVRRVKDAGDARRTVVVLTPKGGEVVESLAREHLVEIQRQGAALEHSIRRVVNWKP